MRVLDIDLDFFLNDICPLAAKGERPCLAGHEPWDKDAVRRYLEENLGLSVFHPIPGRIFETHDGAIFFWKELINAGRLKAPFEVVHIDAHSDLGIGYPGPSLVLQGALCQKPETRSDIERHRRNGQLDEASYLLFALACRWVSNLTNIRNPRSLPDVPGEIRHGDKELQLHTAFPQIFVKMNGPEPIIPYFQYDNPYDYRTADSFDFASLAISPRYAPKEADALAEVIGEYFCLE